MSDEYKYQFERFADKHYNSPELLKASKSVLKEIWKESWDNNNKLNNIISSAEIALKFYIRGWKRGKNGR